MVPPDHGRHRFPEMPTRRLFLIGSGLMLVWPTALSLLEPPDRLIEYLIYFLGAFLLIFDGPIEQLNDWSYHYSDRIGDLIGIGLFGLMAVMWLVILVLPWIGHWNRRPWILWFSQSAYAAAQAVPGYFFAQAHL